MNRLRPISRLDLTLRSSFKPLFWREDATYTYLWAHLPRAVGCWRRLQIPSTASESSNCESGHLSARTDGTTGSPRAHPPLGALGRGPPADGDATTRFEQLC